MLWWDMTELELHQESNYSRESRTTDNWCIFRNSHLGWKSNYFDPPLQEHILKSLNPFQYLHVASNSSLRKKLDRANAICSIQGQLRNESSGKEMSLSDTDSFVVGLNFHKKWWIVCIQRRSLCYVNQANKFQLLGSNKKTGLLHIHAV